MGSKIKPIAPGAAGRMVTRDWTSDVHALLKTFPPRVIVDGGAHTGRFTRKFLQHYKNARIHAFEPIPSLATNLTKSFPKRVTVHAVALGDKNEDLKFNVLAYKGASSVFEPSPVLKAFQKGKTAVSRVLTVPCRRLESIIPAVDLIKLDLQGYELNALKGCGALLKATRLIVTEIEFIPLYNNQPLFSDIAMYLSANNFRLFNLYDLWTHPHGQLTAGNAIFINRSFYA